MFIFQQEKVTGRLSDENEGSWGHWVWRRYGQSCFFLLALLGKTIVGLHDRIVATSLSVIQ